MMVDRIPTGIEGLDRLIEGGIPKFTSGVIMTDRRSPGALFGKQILWNSLTRGLSCAYFHTRYSSREEFLNEMAGHGWNIEAYVGRGSLLIVDYVELAELTPEEERSKRFTGDARKIEGRIISAAKLTELTRTANYDFALYDDIDLLFRRIEKTQFVDWAETVAKHQKERGGVALALVYQGTLPTDMMAFVERLGADCVIELRTDESPDGMLQHYFRVPRMKATSIVRHGWTPYMSDKQGITTV